MNNALDNAVMRESTQSRKKSIIVKAQTIHEKAIHLHTPQGEMPTFQDAHWDTQKKRMLNDIKNPGKKTVRENHYEANVTYLCGLLK